MATIEIPRSYYLTLLALIVVNALVTIFVTLR
jgi:hypothetical protein